ncbi:MAG: FAD binding domain-containing protein [Pseudodonghicola sp.]|nr:FAD binding domain-containing protein [Pseudodonghicola sp.]
MGPTEWVFPDTLACALAELAKPDTQGVAGGTTVLDLMKMGHETGVRFVDLSRLDLKRISESADVTVIGGLASNTDVANAALIKMRHPALSDSILLGASQQIRNAATVGGNLMQATRCSFFRSPDWPCNRRAPGSGCAAMQAPGSGHAILGTSSHCIATHPSDMAVALLALDATIVCETLTGRHRIPMAQFYRQPGETPSEETRLPAGALIVAVEVPHDPLFQSSGYLKLRGRASYEFATASVAAAIELENGVVHRVAIALGGIATVPWRDASAEALLLGNTLTDEGIDLFCDHLLAAADTRPETQHKAPLIRGAIHHMLKRLAEQ